MGIDCSLLILNENGLREIELDRYYVFDGIDSSCEWRMPSELKQQINSIINTSREMANGYKVYWQAYAIACIEQLTNDELDKVAIISEQHSIISRIHDVKEVLKRNSGFHNKQVIRLTSYDL